jgi:excinuclease ABC subunit C
LRDEAHRFAIGTHRRSEPRGLTTSTLDEVPGIGPNAQARIVDALRHGAGGEEARRWKIWSAPGISRAMARQIYDYFHPRG